MLCYFFNEKWFFLWITDNGDDSNDDFIQKMNYLNGCLANFRQLEFYLLHNLSKLSECVCHFFLLLPSIVSFSNSNIYWSTCDVVNIDSGSRNKTRDKTPSFFCVRSFGSWPLLLGWPQCNLSPAHLSSCLSPHFSCSWCCNHPGLSVCPTGSKALFPQSLPLWCFLCQTPPHNLRIHLALPNS